ncbi:glycosyltransferase [Ferruginibacter sp.]
MVSVIICSVRKDLATQIKANIENSIGVPWQDIIIDNTNPGRGINAVYNEGVRKAKFEIICFVHEDVAFKTDNWGKLLVSYFESDPKLGMLGVAGAGYKSQTPSGWMTGIEEFDRYSILHTSPSGNDIRMHFDQLPAAPLKKVAVLDGVLLCSRKSILEQIPFDEQRLPGFHLYDIDISFRIAEKYEVAVSFEIDLVHFTEGGNFGDSWLENTLNWHQFMRSRLPFKKGEKTVVDKGIENRIAKFWLNRLRIEKISLANKWRWIKMSGAVGNPARWINMGIFLFYRPLYGKWKKK